MNRVEPDADESEAVDLPEQRLPVPVGKVGEILPDEEQLRQVAFSELRAKFVVCKPHRPSC